MIEIRDLQLWLRNHNYYQGPIDGKDTPAVEAAVGWVVRDRLYNHKLTAANFSNPALTKEERSDIENNALAEAKNDIAQWPKEKMYLMASQMFLRAKGFQNIVANGEESAETNAAKEHYNARKT